MKSIVEEAEEQAGFQKLVTNLPSIIIMLTNIFRGLAFAYCCCCFTVGEILVQLEFEA